MVEDAVVSADIMSVNKWPESSLKASILDAPVGGCCGILANYLKTISAKISLQHSWPALRATTLPGPVENKERFRLRQGHSLFTNTTENWIAEMVGQHHGRGHVHPHRPHSGSTWQSSAARWVIAMARFPYPQAMASWESIHMEPLLKLPCLSGNHQLKERSILCPHEAKHTSLTAVVLHLVRYSTPFLRQECLLVPHTVYISPEQSVWKMMMRCSGWSQPKM